MKAKAKHPVFLVFLFLVASFSGFIYPCPAHADFIRVRGTVVNVRQGPGTTYPVLFQAKQGDEFPLKKTEGLWCLVQLEKGKDAWVFARLVDVVAGEIPGSPASTPEEETDEASTSLLRKAVKPSFYLLLFLVFLYLLRNRRRLLKKTSMKLMEASGYNREKPFRYDDHQPRDDRWDF